MLVGAGIAIGRTDWQRAKVVRSAILENSQIPVTMDDEAALLWLMGVKAEKILAQDRTALDMYLTPTSNYFASWAPRLVATAHTSPHLAARLRDLLGNRRYLSLVDWDPGSTFDTERGLPALLDAHLGAAEVRPRPPAYVSCGSHFRYSYTWRIFASPT